MCQALRRLALTLMHHWVALCTLPRTGSSRVSGSKDEPLPALKTVQFSVEAMKFCPLIDFFSEHPDPLFPDVEGSGFSFAFEQQSNLPIADQHPQTDSIKRVIKSN